MESHYEILQVSPNAELETIKAAYRSLMLRYHPDHFTGEPRLAEQRAQRINEAYYVLSDPIRRQQYDADLTGGSKGASFTSEGPFPSPSLFEFAPSLPNIALSRSSLPISLLFSGLAVIVAIVFLRPLIAGAQIPRPPAEPPSSETEMAQDAAPSSAPATSSVPGPSQQFSSSSTASGTEAEADVPPEADADSAGPDRSAEQVATIERPLSNITPDTMPPLQDSMMRALDTGEPTKWQAGDTGASGVVLVSRLRRFNDQICRNVRYTVHEQDRNWVSPDVIACRAEGQLWRVVGGQ